MRQLQLAERINAYIKWMAEHPSIWDAKHTPRGVPRKGRPFRLTEPA